MPGQLMNIKERGMLSLFANAATFRGLNCPSTRNYPRVECEPFTLRGERAYQVDGNLWKRFIKHC
jgi:hypothetical protein